MERDGPTLPLDSTEARDVLDFLLLIPFLPIIARQSNPIPTQASSRNRRSIAKTIPVTAMR